MEEVEDVEGCWCWQQRDGAAIFFFYLVSYVGIFATYIQYHISLQNI